MWRAILNGMGGELDRIDSDTEDGLKRGLLRKFDPESGEAWELSHGDTIVIEYED